MQIGPLHLTTPFILAPLAGFTDLAFRRLCREYGAALCYSEMISCHGLVYGQKKTQAMLRTTPEERPVALQLFGNDPEIMGEAAALISACPVDQIDINMGCPVKKVIKRGAGAALLQHPGLARQIIRKICENSTLPVTIKIRSGWNRDNIIAEDFAKMAEDAGVQAIAIHARTWSQGFSGSADWQIITRVKKAVAIPVIGNGDILTHDDGLAMMAATGCDGVMIGRGALANPWIFQPADRPVTMSARLAALKRHLELIAIHDHVDRALAKTKNHAGRYFKSLPGAAGIRRRIYDTKSFTELQDLINKLKLTANTAPFC